MKIIKKKDTILAKEIFTDREEPRKVFWDEYQKILKEKDYDSVHVIQYYGIGGIGKTSLLSKLKNEVANNNINENPILVELDFSNRNQKEVFDCLLCLRNQFADKYKFEFKLFDLAYLIYLKKINEQMYGNNDTVIDKFVNSSPFVTSLLDIAKEVLPGFVGVVTMSVVQLINLIGKKVKESYIQEEIDILKDCSIENLRTEMIEFFAADINRNMQITKFNGPIVFFLDTYELLVDYLKDNPFAHDYWLRSTSKQRPGLIPLISNAIWVIAGRDKLRWVEDKFSNWDNESLSLHLIENLSEADTNHFLKLVGVEEEYHKKIYQESNGNPLWIDLLVEDYNNKKDKQISIKSKEVSINHHILLERYFKDWSIQLRELADVLSVLGKWSDEELTYVCTNLKKPVIYNKQEYENLKEKSVIKSYDEYYELDRSISEVFSENINENLKKEIIKIDNEFKNKNDSLCFDALFHPLLIEIIEIFEKYKDDDVEAYNRLLEYQDKIEQIEKMGILDMRKSESKRLILYFIKEVLGFIWICGDHEDYESALKIYRKSMAVINNSGFGNTFLPSFVTRGACNIYFRMGDKENAYLMAKKTFEIRTKWKESFKEEEYVDAAIDYVTSCMHTSRYEEAKEIQEKIVGYKLLTIGFDNESTKYEIKVLFTIYRNLDIETDSYTDRLNSLIENRVSII